MRLPRRRSDHVADPAATEPVVVRRDVPTMYHANGKQRGTGGNSGDLKPLNRCEKMDIYQGERLNLAS